MDDRPEARANPLDALRAIPGRADELLVDQLSAQLDRTRRLLLGDTDAAAEQALDRIGGQEAVEARIAADLAMPGPLAEPERFLEAHRLTMRALEVLDRDGSRSPGSPRLGPLSAVGRPLVEMVTDYIVKSYGESVVGTLRKLYARREAQCLPDAPERRSLARARVEADRLAPGFKGGVSATVLLLAGAAIPGLASVSQYVGAIDFTNQTVLFTAVGVLFALFLLLSSVLLRGAAVARRRSRLIMAQPLAALWQTIGHAGDPPEDDSKMLATVAIVITGLLWIAGPLAVVAVVLLTD